MRDGRVNGYEAEWCERATATRYRLRRVDENVCDAYTTDETPVTMLDPNVPVEIKACRVRISNGHGYTMKGRYTFHRRNHETLVDRDGQYALPLYELTDDETLLLRRCGLLPAATISELLDEFKRKRQKLAWDRVYETVNEPDIYRDDEPK